MRPPLACKWKPPTREARLVDFLPSKCHSSNREKWQPAIDSTRLLPRDRPATIRLVSSPLEITYLSCHHHLSLLPMGPFSSSCRLTSLTSETWMGREMYLSLLSMAPPRILVGHTRVVVFAHFYRVRCTSDWVMTIKMGLAIRQSRDPSRARIHVSGHITGTPIMECALGCSCVRPCR